MKVRSFFVMDENFLLQRVRTLRLLQLMERHNKAWSLYVFSSANALKSYSMEQLVSLGITWVWLGLEGMAAAIRSCATPYARSGSRAAVARIRVLVRASSAWRNTLPKTSTRLSNTPSATIPIPPVHAVHADPGTPLYAQMEQDGVMLGPDAISDADVHGQYRFNYRHPSIRRGPRPRCCCGRSSRFRRQRPSVMRIIRTSLAGWRRYKNHADPRIRDRFAWELKGYSTFMAGALWASRRWFRDNPVVAER